jgi:hypothetical protein
MTDRLRQAATDLVTAYDEFEEFSLRDRVEAIRAALASAESGDEGLRELERRVGAYLDDLTFGRDATGSLDALRHHFVWGIERRAAAQPEPRSTDD